MKGDALCEVILLGTGGPLRDDRARLGLLVTARDCPPLLIDTCGGFELVQQLARVGYAVGDIGNVIVTHRHGDHIGGAMPLLMSGHPLTFYGPEDALTGIKELMAATYPEWACALPTKFTPVVPSRSYDMGGLVVEFFEVEHRVPTFAVRVSHQKSTVAYSADSLPCDALVACARDADLFVCDALGAETDGVNRRERVRELMHPTAREAAEIATKAKAHALALVHLGRSAQPRTICEEGASVFPGPVTVPDDSARYVLARS